VKYEEIKNKAKSLYEDKINSAVPKILIGTGTCGISMGAKEIIAEFENQLKKHNLQAKILKVGCLGICSFEPLVCIMKKDYPTVCYRNVNIELVRRLVYNYLIEDDPCLEFALGTLELKEDGSPYIPELPRFEKETRVILKLAGYIEPEDINDYIALGGYEGLNKALNINKEQIIEEIKKSKLRGRGGAGFLTGIKWELCKKENNFPKYIIANGDEGDPGAFMDRVLLESVPHQVIEGMLIAGYTLDASKGYIYVRAEYPLALERLKIALRQAQEYGLIGKNILDSGFNFDIKLFSGQGAFVGGEETGLIHSIEGKRPTPSLRPPYPTEKGLFGKPTLINNVKTYACIPQIVLKGAEWFLKLGTEESPGTMVFCLAGKIKNSGWAEVELGTTLKKIIFDIGGGIKEDKQLKAVQIGGPSGGCIPSKFINTQVDYKSLQAYGAIMGSGGLIVLDETSCMVDVAKYFLSFTQAESCGQCTFCRVGTKQMLLILEDICKGEGKIEDLDLLWELAWDIKEGALCGLGKTAPNPVLTTLKYFKDEYIAHIVEKRCPAKVCKELISYYIIPERCNRGCEHCILKCPAEDCIKPNEQGIKVIDQEKCIRCGTCIEVCPKEYNAVVKISPKIKF
jgi:NADH-quinone oxidoreductase subunit F